MLINKKLIKGSYPFYFQRDEWDCGLACLKMICHFYGKESLSFEIDEAFRKKGLSLLDLSTIFKGIGFYSFASKIHSQDFNNKTLNLPLIAFLKKKHYVVIYEISSESVLIGDPATSLHYLKKDDFFKHWLEGEVGIVMIVGPDRKFFLNKENFSGTKVRSFLKYYLYPYKNYIIWIALFLILGICLQFFTPFLNQSLVDIGISNKDLKFILFILFFQIIIFCLKIITETTKNWLLIHLSSRINISILTDFLIKLFSLPFSFFNQRKIGDLLQRINDNQRVTFFITNSFISFSFSLFSFVLFSFLLAYYNYKIFVFFIIWALCYFIWVYSFLKRRAKLDNLRFQEYSNNQNQLIQMINGVQDLKIYNAIRFKRWDWEINQIRIFKLNLNFQFINQLQSNGGSFLVELKNIIITYFCVQEIIMGNLSFGSMMSITFISLQLDSPINQFINFIQSGQDAALSFSRMKEVYNDTSTTLTKFILKNVPDFSEFNFLNFSYTYPNKNSPSLIIDNFSFPSNKIIALVGESGSGKTTFIKVLLKILPEYNGELNLDNFNFNQVNSELWLSQCGAVMHDSFIFSDTIASNIVLGTDDIQDFKVKDVLQKVNLWEFVSSLEMGIYSKLGPDGIGLSQGQKQRILIARAIYRNPKYLFLDEATNALDSTNESIILSNLNKVFFDKSVFIIAHRLSTILSSDLILMFKNGRIVETGKHEELLKNKSFYYDLFQNQILV